VIRIPPSSFFRTATLALLAIAWMGLALYHAWPVFSSWLDNTPEPRPPAPDGVNFLIVAPEGLQVGARAWAEYRRSRGYAVQVEVLPPQEATVEAIRAVIQQVYRRSGAPYPFYVLLIGHAHPGSSYPGSYLPAPGLALEAEQALELGADFIPGDEAYALDPETGAWLPVAFGRVPAWIEPQVSAVLDRVRAYETHPPQGAGRARLEFVASASEWGPLFDRLAEFLLAVFWNTHLPPAYSVHTLSGDPASPYSFPLPDLPAETARRLDSGALLFSYAGHGMDKRLSPAFSPSGERGPVFSYWDALRLEDSSTTLATFVACSAGRYDLPGDDLSLAELLVLFDAGPVATFAGSRVTFAVPNTLLQMDLLMLLENRPETAGEWLRQAKIAYANPGADRSLPAWGIRRLLPDLYRMTIRSDRPEGVIPTRDTFLWQRYAYNLFGDPALALALPRIDLALQAPAWLPAARRLRFSGGGDLPPGRTVTVTLEALPGSMLPGAQPGDGQAMSYRRANDKTAARTTVVTGVRGNFQGELSLPRSLPAGSYRLRAVIATGEETRLGIRTVWLGWPLLEVLLSPLVWWLGVTVVLIRRALVWVLPRASRADV
jgi:hypothetical protein